MTQLEQELSALFNDAASRIQIRPMPHRSPRAVAINRALAAGVTAALVAGVVLMATRLGADPADRGGTITPTATQQLLDAVGRTLGQPIRVETTFNSGQGAAQTTVTEEDLDRHELVTYREGQPELLFKGTHAYQGISSTEREMFNLLPASARWVQLPASANAADAAMQSMSGVTSPQLAALINSGRLTVTEIAENTFRVSGSQPAPQGATGLDLQTLHVTVGGLVDWVKINSDIPTGQGGSVMHVTMTARIAPLGHPLNLVLPDPSTVVSQKAYEAATNSGQCSAPADGAVHTCSIGGTVTLHATKAKPRKR